MATSMINNNSMDLLHDSGTINLSHGTAYDTGIAFSDVVGKYKELSIQVNKNGSQAYIVRVPVFSNLLEFLYTQIITAADFSSGKYELLSVARNSKVIFTATKVGWSGDKVINLKVYGVK